jgi:hypothetical protein
VDRVIRRETGEERPNNAYPHRGQGSTGFDQILDKKESIVIRHKRRDVTVLQPIDKYNNSQPMVPMANLGLSSKGLTLRLLPPSVGIFTSTVDLFQGGKVLDPVLALTTIGILAFIMFNNNAFRDVIRYLSQR